MSDPLWGIVLAGGTGLRLKPLAQRICGDDRPKQYVPVLGDRTLLRAARFLGTDEEAWALHQAYALMRTVSFSRAILEPCPPFLAVSAIPRGRWSDLGTPRRVFEVLASVHTLPAWVRAADRAAS